MSDDHLEGTHRALTLDMGKCIGFSTYIPSSYAFSDERLGDINVQLHGMRDRGEAWRNPILALGIDADGLKIWSRWDDMTITENKHCGGTHQHKIPLGDSMGRWTD